MVYVEAKSDQYERSYVCLKFNSILSRATLGRFVRTLQARSSAPSDQILFQHISFFPSGSDLKKSSLSFFTENFFWPFPPSFSETEKKIGNSLAEIRTNFARSQLSPQLSDFVPTYLIFFGKFQFKSRNRVATLKPKLGFTLGSDKLKLLDIKEEALFPICRGGKMFEIQ